MAFILQNDEPWIIVFLTQRLKLQFLKAPFISSNKTSCCHIQKNTVSHLTHWSHEMKQS